MDRLHPIKVVVERTGLSDHVIRVWERRYRAVEPVRTATNRRVYSDADIERLTLLRQHTEAGQSISYLAQLSTDELREMAEKRMAQPLASAVRSRSGDSTAARDSASISPSSSVFVENALAAVRSLDPAAFKTALNSAETHLGVQGTLQRVVAPLAHAVGEEWRSGSITAAHEHFATGMVRSIVGQWVRPFTGTQSGPAILIATPAGQLHELGALISAATASNLGWRVVYLGVSLPSSEIAAAARQHGARAVALSIVYPHDDPQLPADLIRLRELLPSGCAVVAGGRAASAYASALSQIGAQSVTDFAAFGDWLDQLRGAPALP